MTIVSGIYALQQRPPHSLECQSIRRELATHLHGRSLGWELVFLVGKEANNHGRMCSRVSRIRDHPIYLVIPRHFQRQYAIDVLASVALDCEKIVCFKDIDRIAG
jgi:hypothetical protein